ncbi:MULTISPECIES: cation:proton antiporter [Corynebacterium]|uniref:Cation:proton antiporter n=1 Tax=Corynebacterium pseudogenitalium TaxID=38303 RepID=A0ABD4TP92_9CORY|nr:MULTISPECIES: cation:proton antiporter [Corynebacterium]MCQ4614137.1 cation:proton antiporter [Corynebacterium pseudogenitalium]OFT30927.1 cation:proton antiporter [Corynebacterium sp. HMSC08D02]OIR40926.1 cation:proton antiporter [Corynebacterium sp. NML140438]OIR44835.1 cation:proton antiporter [Corynebacterium sp. NML130628]WPJ92044.1 cation:proton antiporter [Corynebacterium sp. UMB2355A]
MFETILMGCVIVMALSLLVGLAGLILVKDELSRAVMADLIFYAMVTIFLVWSIWTPTMIGYEIAILAGLVCGVIPTISMARIITRGRR